MKRKGLIVPLPKLPGEPDGFKYFERDPPEVKLEAWKCLQNRLAIRDVVFGLARAASLIVAIFVLWMH